MLMEIIYGLPATPLKESTYIALGSFDGVHLGHQALITHAVIEGEKAKGNSIVLTFEPHPLKVLNPKQPLNLILSNRLKANRIAALKPDQLIFLPFTSELAYKTPEQFVVMLKKILNPYALVIGFDYSFGKGGSGNPELLKALGKNLGFEVHIIPAQNYEGSPISSTRIRQALTLGDIDLAKQLLGYWPLLEGMVMDGEKRGRKLGFPTANLKMEDSIVLPREGVYAARIYLSGIKYFGVVNVGKKPTFGGGREKSVEVHIIDFQKDIYGDNIEIQFLGRIRSEIKFENPSQLINQIQVDINAAQKILMMKS